MNWQYSPYALFLLIAVGVSVAFAVYAWRRRVAPGAATFAIFMVAVAELVLAHALQLAGADQATKILWAKIGYLGLVTAPPLWLLFALGFSGHSRWITQRTIALLLTIPTITLALAWTYELNHQLIWRALGFVRMSTSSALVTSLPVTYGPWFWLHLIYSYALVAAGTWLIIKPMLRAPRQYRHQISALLVGVTVPILINFWYIAAGSWITNVDLTPFVFTLAGIALCWSLFRFRLLEVLPVVRDTIFENMYAGVIVLDIHRRIIDFNPAAEHFFSWPRQDVTGRPLAEVMPELADRLPQTDDGPDSRTIITLSVDDHSRIYELTFTPLRNRYGYCIGCMAVLRDMTEHKQAEAKLRENEARYRVVSELTSDFTYAVVIDPTSDMEIEWITDAFYRITEFTTPEAVLAQGGWRALAHTEDRKTLALHLRKLLGGQADIAEFRIVKKNGEAIWLRNYGQPQWDAEQGRVTRILGAGQDITEHKRVEAALRESEERYRLLFESNPNPMWVYDHETLAFLTVNEEAVRTYGYSRDEFLRMRLTDLLPEHGVSVLIKPQIQADGTTQMAGIWQHRKKDGSLIDVEIRSHALSFAGRAAQAILANDVTARRQAEQALRESEERYRRLVEYSPEPIAVYSEGILVYVNSAAVKLYGANTPGELEGRPISDLVHPTRRALLTAEAWTQQVKHPLEIIEEKLLRLDGESIDVEIAAIPTTYLGKPATQVVSRDITERKRVEETLRQQNEYFAALHDTTLAVMNRLEVEDVLETIVVRAGALVGTEHGYLYSGDPDTGASEVKVGVGIFRPFVGQPLRPGMGVDGMVWLTGQPLTVNNYQEWFWRIRDEGMNELRSMLGVPLTSGSQIVGVLGLAHIEEGRSFGDEEIAILTRFAELASIALENARLYTTAQQELAERKHAEEKLAYARDEALEAARLKSEFLATMSHELRTPLNAIIGFTDFMLESTIDPLNEQQRDKLQRVSRNAHNLRELIDGILDLSKIDAGRMQMATEPVRLYEVVSSAVSNIETLVTNKQLQVTIQQITHVPLIYGDSGRLRQIVLNLLSNAVKFTPQQGKIGVILEHGTPGILKYAALPLEGLAAGNWIALSVRDNGIGIPPEEHSRIWSEFYQIDGSATRQYSGTGLGLTIVRRLTELMCGRVGLQSIVDEGSTFTIWLPITSMPESLQPSDEPQAQLSFEV
ncbi:MAG TPA: histidine kinase N-terminal 7TM domain-containing protein [Herpetosiphonaceae bacterium]